MEAKPFFVFAVTATLKRLFCKKAIQTKSLYIFHFILKRNCMSLFKKMERKFNVSFSNVDIVPLELPTSF